MDTAQKPTSRVRRFLFGLLAAVTMMLGLPAIPALLGVADAAGGDYTIDFAAADPGDYIPAVPFPGAPACSITGAGNGDALIPDAHHTDPATSTETNVESLAPEDMALGQIVPFEIKITVNGDTQPEDGNISFDASWSTLTTSNADFGYDDSIGLLCAFVDTSDGGTMDPGGDATVTGFTSTTVGDDIIGSIDIGGLDDGDMAVIEAWLVLKDTIPPGSTGNVQSGLVSAETSTGDTINTGNQTVPLLRVQEFFTADADLSVTKTDAPDPVEAGGQLTYTVTVTNGGPSIANSVVLTDTLDPNTTFVSASADNGGTCSDSAGTVTCDLGAVVPGPENAVVVTIVVDVSPTAPTGDPNGEDLTNTASVDSITDDPDPTNNTATEPTDVTPPGVPALSVDKTYDGIFDDADGSGDVSPGDLLLYTIIATNTGDVTLTNVVLTDVLTNDSASCPTVPPGGTCLPSTPFQFVYEVQAGDVGTTITNVATADSDQTDPVTDTEDVPVPSPALLVDKTFDGVIDDADGSGDVSPGDTLQYTVTATNSGTANLTSVTVTDDLITPSSETCVGPLVPSGTCTLTGTYVVQPGDVGTTITNTGTADSDQTDPVTDTEEVPVGAPGLIVDKSLVGSIDADGSGDVSAGDTLQYFIEATNTGDTTLTNVTVSDDLTGDSGACASVDPLGSCTLDVSYVVQAGDLGTDITNTATADSDQTDPVTDTVDVPVPDPALSIEKTFTGFDDLDGSGDISEGDLLFYDVVATNVGTAILTNVMITDDLTGGSVTCVLPPTGPGETCSGSFSYFVTAADLGTTITNVATADSDQTDPVTDTEDVPVGAPDLLVEKTLVDHLDADGSGDVSDGDTLQYFIEVTNTGQTTLTNVTVSDDLTGDSGSCASVLPGDSCTLDVSYVVQLSDLGTTITNTATADSDQTDPETDTEDVPVPDPALSIEKTFTGFDDLDGSGDISEGDLLFYDVVATNVGTANLTNVTITDDLTGGSVTCISPPIGPGETCAGGFGYFVTAADLGTTVTNTAEAVSDQTPDPVTDTEDVPIPAPGLSIDKTFDGVIDDADGSGDVSPGDTLQYTVTATNSGAASLTNVTVTDDLITPSSETCAGPLVPSDTCTLTGTYVVQPGDVGTTITNTGTADSDQTDPVTDTEDVPVPQPSLLFGKFFIPQLSADVDGTGTWSPGDVLVYFVIAANNGEANITNLVLEDTTLGLSGACTSPLPPSQGLFDAGWCLFGYAYTVTEADAIAGEFANSAIATADQVPDIPSDVTVPIDQLPEIEVTKTAGSAVTEEGGYVEFTVEVENQKDEPVTINSIVDTPYGDILDGANPNVVGTDCAAGAVLNTTGDTYTCAFTAFVEPPDLTDTVTVDGVDPEGNPASDSDDAVVVEKPEGGVIGKGYEDPALIPDEGVILGDYNRNGVCDTWETCIELTEFEAQWFADWGNRGTDLRFHYMHALVLAWLNAFEGCNDFVCIETELNQAIDELIAAGLSNIPGSDHPLEGGTPWDSSTPTWVNGASAATDAMNDYSVTGGTCASPAVP